MSTIHVPQRQDSMDAVNRMVTVVARYVRACENYAVGQGIRADKDTLADLWAKRHATELALDDARATLYNLADRHPWTTDFTFQPGE